MYPNLVSLRVRQYVNRNSLYASAKFFFSKIGLPVLSFSFCQCDVLKAGHNLLPGVYKTAGG
jgi:hypothetical protein